MMTTSPFFRVELEPPPWLSVLMARLPLWRRLYLRLAADLKAALPDDARLLDVGTGPGYLLGHLATMRPDVKLFGLELSWYMLANGRSRQQVIAPGAKIASLQKYARLAPVIEKSGRQCWIHWRWHAPTFLRQTFVDWAGQTVVYSTWAKAYYQRMKTKGKNHHVILRALAFKWIRILWKCWQCRTPYDETRYLALAAETEKPLCHTHRGLTSQCKKSQNPLTQPTSGVGYRLSILFGLRSRWGANGPRQVPRSQRVAW